MPVHCRDAPNAASRSWAFPATGGVFGPQNRPFLRQFCHRGGFARIGSSLSRDRRRTLCTGRHVANSAALADVDPCVPGHEVEVPARSGAALRARVRIEALAAAPAAVGLASTSLLIDSLALQEGRTPLGLGPVQATVEFHDGGALAVGFDQI